MTQEWLAIVSMRTAGGQSVSRQEQILASFLLIQIFRSRESEYSPARWNLPHDRKRVPHCTTSSPVRHLVLSVSAAFLDAKIGHITEKEKNDGNK